MKIILCDKYDLKPAYKVHWSSLLSHSHSSFTKQSICTTILGDTRNGKKSNRTQPKDIAFLKSMTYDIILM